MKRIWIAMALLLGSLPAIAQTAATPPASAAPALNELAKGLLRQWNEVSRKVVTMAEDFAEEQYDYRAAKDVRTFKEQLLHIAGSNYYFMARARGEKPSEDDPPADKYKSRADVAAFVKKSFAEGGSFFSEDPSATKLRAMVAALEHAGEHYGQLVFYYRTRGLVPPESRPR